MYWFQPPPAEHIPSSTSKKFAEKRKHCSCNPAAVPASATAQPNKRARAPASSQLHGSGKRCHPVSTIINSVITFQHELKNSSLRDRCSSINLISPSCHVFIPRHSHRLQDPRRRLMTSFRQHSMASQSRADLSEGLSNSPLGSPSTLLLPLSRPV